MSSIKFDRELKQSVDGLVGRMERFRETLSKSSLIDLFLGRLLVLDKLGEFAREVKNLEEFPLSLICDGSGDLRRLRAELCRVVNRFVLDFFNPLRIQEARQRAAECLNDPTWREVNLCAVDNITNGLLEMRKKEIYEKTYHFLLVLLDEVGKIGPENGGPPDEITAKFVRENLIYLYPATVGRVIHNI